jgi:hypothetical protein
MKFRDLLFPLLLIFVLGCNSVDKIDKTEPSFISIKCKTYELAPNGKYKYSFLVKNYDPIKSVFNGTIDISIISKEGRPIRYDTFDLINFKNGESKIFSLEAMTGVVSVHGDAGIEKYGYSIKSVPETYTKEGFNIIEQYKLDDNNNLLDQYK